MWDGEFKWGNAFADPVEALIHGFGFFGGDGLSGQANGACIVTKHGCGWLGVANVFEGVAFGDAELGIGTCPSEFCFGSRTHFDRDAGGKAFNGGVDEVGAVIAEGVVPSGFRAGFGKGEA